MPPSTYIVLILSKRVVFEVLKCRTWILDPPCLKPFIKQINLLKGSIVKIAKGREMDRNTSVDLIQIELFIDEVDFFHKWNLIHEHEYTKQSLHE